MNEGQNVMHTLESQDIRWDADEGVTQFRVYLKDLLQVHGIILETGPRDHQGKVIGSFVILLWMTSPTSDLG